MPYATGWGKRAATQAQSIRSYSSLIPTPQGRSPSRSTSLVDRFDESIPPNLAAYTK